MRRSVVFGIAAILLVSVFADYVWFTQVTQDSLVSEAPEAVMDEWLRLLLTLTRETPGFAPPVAARAFGYTGVSLYESVRFSLPESQSLAGQLEGFEPGTFADLDTSGEYDWELVANANLAAMARALYPSVSGVNQRRIDTLEQQLYEHHATGLDETVIRDSVTLGLEVAERVLRYAESDGQAGAHDANFPAGYEPPVGDGLWEPAPGEYRSALLPGWGDVRPFLSANVRPTLPPPPPAYSLAPESRFFQETMEVYEVVEAITPEERVIAEYWRNDPGLSVTPPGHSVSILRQVLEAEEVPLGEAAIAFATLGIGLHDAFIACWYAKYEYDYVRPITVIRRHIDPGFRTPVDAPPFPEYPSGHSVQAGVTAEILTQLFGDGYAFTDTTQAHRVGIDGTPRSYDSFDAFAHEAAMSRLYGGVHFRAAIEEGLTQGRTIGRNVSALDFGRE